MQEIVISNKIVNVSYIYLNKLRFDVLQNFQDPS